MQLPTITPKDFESASNEHETVHRLSPVLYFSKQESAFVKVAGTQVVSDYLSGKSDEISVKEPTIADIKERGVGIVFEAFAEKLTPVSGQKAGESGAYLFVKNPEAKLIQSPVDAVIVNDQEKTVNPIEVLAGNYVQRYEDGTLGVVTQDDYARLFAKEISREITVTVEPSPALSLSDANDYLDRLLEVRSNRLGISKEEYLTKIGIKSDKDDLSPSM